jgi:hypothetical protein
MDPRKRILSKIAAVGLLGLSANLPLNAQSSRDLARKTFPSVVLLVMQDSGGQPVSLGSGFFVADGVLATNVHVVRGTSTGQAKLVGQAKTYSIDGVVGVDAGADLALLKVSGAKAPALQIDESSDLAVGDVVYAVGNPEGLEGTFSQGIVSGIRDVGPDKLLQITAPISPGSSGGPIIDGRGHVVGVAVATFAEGQNLNFAVPSLYLAALLKHMKEPRSLSSEKELQGNTGSFAQVPGAKSTEAVVGVELAWDDAYMHDFSFTFRNRLQSPVKDIHFVVVFFGSDGNAVDSFEAVTCPGVTILPMLAKRETEAYWSPNKNLGGPICFEMRASAYVANATRQHQIRVLDFKVAK